MSCPLGQLVQPQEAQASFPDLPSPGSACCLFTMAGTLRNRGAIAAGPPCGNRVLGSLGVGRRGFNFTFHERIGCGSKG